MMIGKLKMECDKEISSEILFNFYLFEVIFDISTLLAGCTLNCSKVNF